MESSLWVFPSRFMELLEVRLYFSAFIAILTTAHDRYLSSTLPTTTRPTMWWDRYCRRTYQRKLQAWRRYDWPAYRGSVLAAKKARAITFCRYQRSLRTRLQSGLTDHLWWNLTKNIGGLSKIRDRSAPNVDSLASYFANKLSFSPDFNSSSSIVPPESGVTPRKPWRLKPATVSRVSRSLDVNKAVGPDDISPYILKFCCNELCRPICSLFRRVSRSGEFPPSWKVSHITPVYKHKGSSTDPKFYRPIAVLPTLAMVFERTVYSQLCRHISPYIPPTQFGFILGTGVQNCGAAIAFTAMQALEHRMECRVVSLDIRGAFDSVWWNGLLQYLWSVGLRGRVYKLMCSYLSNRNLFVVAHGNTSSKRPFTAGVPQGGIWSPILFNLYTRCLSAQILHCDLFTYADNTTLNKVIPTKDDRNTAAIEINADLNRACLWGRKWNIILEPDKC